MRKKIVVVGAGPGGYVCALRAAGYGADVTLVEKARLGGTCLNWGCIPSKVMSDCAKKLKIIKNAAVSGIRAGDHVRIDLPDLMKRKETIIRQQQKGIQVLLERAGVNILKGEAKLKQEQNLQVSSDEDIKSIPWDRLILATGSKPQCLKNIHFNGTTILSSDHLLSVKQIPESLVIVGGGVIGCEFASIFAAFGSKITIIEGFQRLLPMPEVDLDISKNLLREFKKSGITVICDAIVSKIEEKDGRISAILKQSPFTDNPSPKPLKQTSISARKAAICIGRKPNVSSLGLENTEIQFDPDAGIPVDKTMETSVKGVYAIGDLLGPKHVMLAHVASHEGMVAAANASGHDARMDYSVIPSAVFTLPEAGMVGLSEFKAREIDPDVKAFTVNFRNIGKAHAINEIEGFAKIVVEPESKKLLGCHILGPNASDLVAQAALAMRNRLGIHDIAGTIHAHPTLSEILMEVCLKAEGSPLHG